MEFIKGMKKEFGLGTTTFTATYLGRFDFLYLFDMELKRFPFVLTSNNKSLAFVNTSLLQQHDFTVEEIRAILLHEVGHQISIKQDELEGMDLEYDADEYAVSKCGKEMVISALEKSIQMINKIGKEENKKKNVADVQARIQNIKLKNKPEIGEER